MAEAQESVTSEQNKKRDRSNFWLGLLLSIPLSIFANLITTPVQNMISRYNEESARQRVLQAQVEYRRIESFYLNRSEFHEYLLSVIINTTFITSLTAMLSYLSFMLVGLTHKLRLNSSGKKQVFDAVRELLQGLGFVALIIGALLVINITKEALRTYSNVKNFDSYKQSIPK